MSFARPGWRLSLGVIALLYALDQSTKWLVLEHIPLHHDVPVIPGFFSLTFVTNRGAAFGMFQGAHVFFLVLSVVVLVGLAVFAWRGAFRDGWSRWGATLLAAGILGNVTDRLLHGYVVDFLDFHIGRHHWPAFNVADSCICIAAGLFILGSFLVSEPSRGPSEPAQKK